MKKSKLERALEILPGFLTWSTFILPIILSFFIPSFVSIVILLYALYWLLKTFVISTHLTRGFLQYRKDIKINWLNKCQKNFPDIWKKYYHMAIIATFKEEMLTLRPSFQALIDSNYPTDKLIIILATEDRDQKSIDIGNALKEEFGHLFSHFLVTRHTIVKGETKGKGSNISYSIREAKREIVDKFNIPYENIIVTTLDADHQVDKQYFASVTHAYLKTTDPTHKSFQPIPLFFNNIWQTSFPMRLIAMGSTYWQMVEATRPYRLRNFASHAQSFAGLVQTDYWSITSIVEDGHQYWRSFFKFKGNYEVIPIFTPIYQDAILAGDFKQSAKEQYLQKRRWAWGCSDIPFAILEALKDKEIPFWSKWIQILRLIEGHYSWATTSIALATVGWMPIILNSPYRSTIIAYNFFFYFRYILYAAMTGMIVTLTISTLLLPKPHTNRNRSRMRIVFEWILTPLIMPFTNIIFGSFPAIESQTRLMLGNDLGDFRVTIKKNIKKSSEV